MNALEGATPGLLGLETDLITFYFSRDGYDVDQPVDLQIPSDFVTEFDAEFISIYEGGYPFIDEESTVFQTLVSIKPTTVEETYEEEESVETFEVTAYVHFAPAPPMGTSLSLLTGLNFSYITGELYRGGSIESSDLAERLSINIAPSEEDDTFFQKIRSVLGIVDWRNISLFKKVIFPDLEPDTYLIKIFRENPLFKNQRQFIGFSIVEVTKDTKLHIFTKKQAIFL